MCSHILSPSRRRENELEPQVCHQELPSIYDLDSTGGCALALNAGAALAYSARLLDATARLRPPNKPRSAKFLISTGRILNPFQRSTPPVSEDNLLSQKPPLKCQSRINQ